MGKQAREQVIRQEARKKGEAREHTETSFQPSAPNTCTHCPLKLRRPRLLHTSMTASAMVLQEAQVHSMPCEETGTLSHCTLGDVCVPDPVPRMSAGFTSSVLRVTGQQCSHYYLFTDEKTKPRSLGKQSKTKPLLHPLSKQEHATGCDIHHR